MCVSKRAREPSGPFSAYLLPSFGCLLTIFEPRKVVLLDENKKELFSLHQTGEESPKKRNLQIENGAKWVFCRLGPTQHTLSTAQNTRARSRTHYTVERAIKHHQFLLLLLLTTPSWWIMGIQNEKVIKWRHRRPSEERSRSRVAQRRALVTVEQHRVFFYLLAIFGHVSIPTSSSIWIVNSKKKD